MRERASVEIFLGVWGSLYRGVRERERKRDTWTASIGWGCDRAGLRGGGFIGGFLGLYGCGFWAFLFWVLWVLVLVC